MDSDIAIKQVPFLDVDMTEPEIDLREGEDGSIYIKSKIPLAPYPNQIVVWLRQWAQQEPERTFLAERDEQSAWKRLSYKAARDAVDRVSQALLDLDLVSGRPVATLADNSIDMGILMLATMQVGIPFMPVSPSYALMSDDYAKLKHVFGLAKPALVYVPSTAWFAKALRALPLGDLKLVAGVDDGEFDALAFDTFKNTKVTAAVDQAFDAVEGDTVAKYLFTSGSTGMSKGVPITHHMLRTNVTGYVQLLPFLKERPPVLLDWLPWNHVAGSNINFNVTMCAGGTMYIDDGRPVPGKFEATLANLRDVQPTMIIGVPLYYDMLVPYLEADDEFCRHVLGKMDLLFYAAAPLPSSLWNRLETLSVKARGVRIPLISSLGATETTPAVVLCHWTTDTPGNLGLPLPGVEIKLTPTAGKQEIRVKGPNVMSGYLHNPEETAAAFDDDGYYCMGDGVRFIDPEAPIQGLVFDGRISENFKLTSGTWVQAGTLRTDIITAMAPYVQDAAVTGEGRGEVGLLVFLTNDGCRKALGLSEAEAATEALAKNATLKAKLVACLQAYNRQNKGSSRRIARIMLMTAPPSANANEINDKGYLNQRAILTKRADLVKRLYAKEPDDTVMVIGA